jgi:hypothetical protein
MAIPRDGLQRAGVARTTRVLLSRFFKDSPDDTENLPLTATSSNWRNKWLRAHRSVGHASTTHEIKKPAETNRRAY